MLSSEAIKQLKQGNVSKNAEKTKERVRNIWKALETPKRMELLNLSGLAKITVERAYKNGSISARLIAAIAQTTQTDPYFLTGETDEQQEYTDALLEEFLKSLGYKIQTKPVPKPRRKLSGKVVPTPENIGENEEEDLSAEDTDDVLELPVKASEIKEETVVTVNSLVSQALKGICDSDKQKLENISEEDLINLMKSLAFRSDFSAGNKELFTLVKYILVR